MTFRAFVVIATVFQSPLPTRAWNSYDLALSSGGMDTINCVLAKLSMFVITGLGNGRRVRSVLFTVNPEDKMIVRSFLPWDCT